MNLPGVPASRLRRAALPKAARIPILPFTRIAPVHPARHNNPLYIRATREPFMSPYSSAGLVIALPRLHPILAEEDARALGLNMPEGIRTLWPGLPGKPKNAYMPALPWLPAQAAACLADFEQSARDGARGLALAPLAAQSLLPSDAVLSPAEQDALARLTERASSGEPSPAASSALRQQREHAQRALLLAWLQEQQALELAELTRSVTQKQSRLTGLLGDGFPAPLPEASIHAERPAVTAWRTVLEAAVTLLDRELQECDLRFLVLDRDMADTLESIPSAKLLPAPAAKQTAADSGFSLLRTHLSSVPDRMYGLPRVSAPAGEREDDPVLTFLCPLFPQATR